MENNGKIDYLRISLTDHCNLNCFYCNPLDKRYFVPHDDILRIEELERLTEMLVYTSPTKVKLVFTSGCITYPCPVTKL